MGLQQGMTNNPHGRKTGTENRTSTELKKLILSILDQNLDNIQEDLEKLSPKDRLFFIEKLMKYVLPTSQKEEPTKIRVLVGKDFADEEYV